MGEKKLLTNIVDISNGLDKSIGKRITITMGTKSDVYLVLEDSEPSDPIPSWEVLKQGGKRSRRIDIDKIDSIEIELESEEE